MNIDDVPESSIEMPAEKMKAIFVHQHELMGRYEPMERKRGLLIPATPYMIDDFAVQHRIKDMFWRTTEEIAEAFEVIPGSLKGWRDRWENEADLRHFFEELADALHFFVEATTYADIEAKVTDVLLDRQIELGHRMPSNAQRQEVQNQAFHFIVVMGLAANCLKNKPWKQTQMQTDQAKFESQMLKAWEAFALLWGMCGATLEDLYMLYARKLEVNKFRQSSNY